MTIETLDTAYTKLKGLCLEIMVSENMPYCAMDFVVSKLQADIQSMHITELTELHINNVDVSADDIVGDK